MKPILIAATMLSASLLTGRPAAAHHSFAMFDQSKVVTLDGTVKDFQWVNPHVVLWVLAPSPDAAADAAPDTWTVELTSPGNLTRLGWTRRSLNPGDKVKVEIAPLRDGTHGGGFRKVTLVDSGQVLTSSFKDLQKADAE
jgi:hypothetical protein